MPKCEIDLREDADNPLIKDAWFDLENGTPRITSLIDETPGGLFPRAMLIFLLLVKYRGQTGNTPIVIKDTEVRSSWLNTIGNSFYDRGPDFLRVCFASLPVVGAARGSQRRPSTVTYYPAHLPLKNLRFYKADSSGKRKELKGKALVDQAFLMETHEDGRRAEWAEITRVTAKRIKRLKKKPQESMGDSLQDPRSLTRVLDNAPTIFQHANQEAQAGIKDLDVFVISNTCNLPTHWENILFEAMAKHGTVIKWAYNSKSAFNFSTSIQAQWRELPDSPLVAPGARLESDEDELKRTLFNLVQRIGPTFKGRFELYESTIAFPYTAMMGVRKSKQSTARGAGVPTGTWCSLAFNSPYIPKLTDRCGLHLREPDPLLKSFYTSIISLFENAGEDGYFQPDETFPAVDEPLCDEFKRKVIGKWKGHFKGRSSDDYGSIILDLKLVTGSTVQGDFYFKRNHSERRFSLRGKLRASEECILFADIEVDKTSPRITNLRLTLSKSSNELAGALQVGSYGHNDTEMRLNEFAAS